MSLVKVISESFGLLKNHPRTTLPFIFNQFINNVLFFAILSYFVFNLGYQRFENFTTNELIVIGVICFVIWFLLISFFSCWGYHQNVEFIKKNNPKLLSSLFNSMRY